MSELERALDRLDGAVSTLIETAKRGRAEEGEHARRIAELEAERDKLRAELAELRAAREDDAQLRAEAADAVKAALGDLRTVLAHHDPEAGQRKAAQGSR